MARRLAGLLLTVVLVSGCATSSAVRFDGAISTEPDGFESRRRIDSEFQIERERHLLAGYRFDGLGILVLAYDRRTNDDDFEPSPDSTIDAYLFAAEEIDWILMRRFAAADHGERSRFSGVYPVRGTISVDRWSGLAGRAIRMDVEAADPKQTRFNGALCRYLEIGWGWYGLGPM